MACATFATANAQDITKDFFKSLPKKGTQTDSIKNRVENDSIPYINPNGSSNRIKEEDNEVDSSLIKPIMKSTFLLRQDYCLYDKREDELYGYDDQEQFGTTYSIGIKCNGFNIVSDCAIRPWEYDEKYGEFKSNKLTPQVTKSWYRYLNDTISSDYSQLDTIVTAKMTIKEKAYYTSAPFVSSQEGMTINNQDTCKTGTLAWFVIEKGNVESADVRVNLEFNTIDTEMFGTKNVVPPSGKQILGGIFVTKSQNADYYFELAGMITKRHSDWILEFPFKGFKNDVNEGSKKTGRLTKINKAKDKKKK